MKFWILKIDLILILEAQFLLLKIWKNIMKEKKEWISKKDKKNIVDTAKDALNLLKKHYPKIGKDY